MALNQSFFSRAKKVFIVLMIIGVIASLLSFFLLPDNYAKLFGVGILVLTANVGLMYLFVRINDNRRPRYRDKKEDKRFDFRK
ncbi:hypothetical protein QYZ87_07500 [Porphyromonadaceae bacterium W3.11]|nr:hypothetical protein [Porphyromonadaceae bacterium W3.11]